MKLGTFNLHMRPRYGMKTRNISRVALAVDSTPNNPLFNLSPEQSVAVDYVLREWRNVYRTGAVMIDTSRYVPGSIPSWGHWSGSDWVVRHAVAFRSEQFRQLGYIHITMMLHLALPPFWVAEHPNEIEAAIMYGRWTDETHWIPPESICGESVWVERNAS